MPRQLIKYILARRDFGAEVTAAGWVRTRRDSKAGFSFLEVGDGSTPASLQVVADGGLANYESDVLRLHTGAAVTVTGELVESPGSGQPVEVRARTLVVHGHADPEAYPIQKKQITYERLRELAHLRPRTNTFGAVTRVRNALAYATHRFFQEHDFLYLHAP
ncbi:MAG TPA: OB-fold nucleic acid binding domain-containing protein, partial [Acidimicrobiia bacterium]|nr:OB-fold nucleic acid binding domain-containing protein [Acidimicrobiia bacterium]